MSSVDFPPEGRKTFAPGGIAGTGTVTVQVPDPGAWYIAAVTFRVACDATVATRTPVVQILDGAGVAVAVSAAGFGATTLLTVDYGWVEGLAEWDSANNVFASGPAPRVPLLPGDAITIQLANGQAGDALSRFRVSLAPLAPSR